MDQKIKPLKDAKLGLDGVDEEKLIRRSLGEESLEQEVVPSLNELRRYVETALEYGQGVNQGQVNDFAKQINGAVTELNAQAERNSQDYIANKAAFLQNLHSRLEAVRTARQPFIIAAIEERGLLDDEGIKKEHKKTLQRMREESEQLLDGLRQESKAAIEEAKKLADEIENRARRTAVNISVGAAQKQFEEAEGPLKTQLLIWAIASSVAIIAFFSLLAIFLTADLPDGWSWHVLYYTAIRITALVAVGTIAAYCMGIFKAHLHLYLHNEHRRRVANCIEAFVQSASTPEQRDMILAQLVEAVIEFGNSGLLHPGNGNRDSKVVVDNITRSLFSPPRVAE